jgi:hypothetical protein
MKLDFTFTTQKPNSSPLNGKHNHQLLNVLNNSKKSVLVTLSVVAEMQDPLHKLGKRLICRGQ